MSQTAATPGGKPPTRGPSLPTGTMQTISPEYRAAKRHRWYWVIAVILVIGAVVGGLRLRQYLYVHSQMRAAAEVSGGGEVYLEDEDGGWAGLAELGSERQAGVESRGRSHTGRGGGGGASTGGGVFSVTGGAVPEDDADLSPEERLMRDLQKESMAILDEELAEQETKPWIDMIQVEAVMHEVSPHIRRCYADRLEADPGLRGTMNVSVTIDLDGKVSRVRADPGSSSLLDDELESCVSRHVRSRSYPKPRGGAVTFNYPFRFGGA